MRKWKPRRTPPAKPIAVRRIDPVPAGLFSTWLREQSETPTAPACLYAMAEAVTCRNMTGMPYRTIMHPCTGVQFRECLAFEQRHPVFAPRRRWLASLSLFWHAIVEHWDELERWAGSDDRRLDEWFHALSQEVGTGRSYGPERGHTEASETRENAGGRRKTKTVAASRKTVECNVFRILGMGHQEIKHSNLLAWLFDPHSSHGCGDRFARLFIGRFAIQPPKGGVSYRDLRVTRETESNIDLLLISPRNRLVVCIENKVFAPLEAGQLDKYHEYVEREYADYDRFYLYLTPTGRRPEHDRCSDPGAWVSISYPQLAETLYATVFRDGNGVTDTLPSAPVTRFLVASYLSLLEEERICAIPDGWRRTIEAVTRDFDDAQRLRERIGRLEQERTRLKNRNADLRRLIVRDSNRVEGGTVAYWRLRAAKAEHRLAELQRSAR